MGCERGECWRLGRAVQLIREVGALERAGKRYAYALRGLSLRVRRRARGAQAHCERDSLTQKYVRRK